MQEAMEVKLQHFEGPLDLLLHLIKRYELDIYDIPIAEITHQYVSYLKEMKDQQLHVAGDFLVMASTLMAIKSKMMLPRTEEGNAEEEDYEDPRQVLTDRLVEYQLYKNLSSRLEEKFNVRQKYYTKEASDLSAYQEVVLLEEKFMNSDQLQEALLRVYKRYKMMNPPESVMDREEISLEDKMIEMKELLLSSDNQEIYFSKCVKSLDVREVVISFLSLLELMKQGVLCAVQKNLGGDILLTYVQE